MARREGSQEFLLTLMPAGTPQVFRKAAARREGSQEFLLTLMPAGTPQVFRKAAARREGSQEQLLTQKNRFAAGCLSSGTIPRSSKQSFPEERVKGYHPLWTFLASFFLRRSLDYCLVRACFGLGCR
ncbi:MAG: hypothetical protein PHD32_11050 [Eubacteriales bacterium]|nr:hypothetical protein [Eubacteriales bacterium]